MSMSLSLWKQEEEFGKTVTAQQKCVSVNKNGEIGHGKVLYVEPDWTLQDFLNAASKRLNLMSTANRVFNADGAEIDDCMMIEDNDILFVSHDRNFILPNRPDNSLEYDVPKTVGGYLIGSMLGRGGFGEVRVGEHQVTSEKVALKFLRKSEIGSIGAVERTTNEIQCLSALKHPNIIRLHQHLESPEHVVLVFELMKGGDLYHYLLDRQQNSELFALTEDEVRGVFSQVLSAIGYAHNQHICHRDLKLENILLKTNDLSCVKVADFGLSAFFRPGAVMKSTCGTLSFLAPEVFRGGSNSGPPLDVWSLGVIIFALLCGRLPFEGPDLSGAKRPRDSVIKSRIIKCQYKIDEALSPEVKDLVRRMLRVDPAIRATIPEVFSHCWMRSNSNMSFEYKENSSTGLFSSPLAIMHKQISTPSTTESCHSSPLVNSRKLSLHRMRLERVDDDAIHTPQKSRSHERSGASSNDTADNDEGTIFLDDDAVLHELNSTILDDNDHTKDGEYSFEHKQDNSESLRPLLQQSNHETISPNKANNESSPSFFLVPLKRLSLEKDESKTGSGRNSPSRPSTVHSAFDEFDHISNSINSNLRPNSRSPVDDRTSRQQLNSVKSNKIPPVDTPMRKGSNDISASSFDKMAERSPLVKIRKEIAQSNLVGHTSSNSYMDSPKSTKKSWIEEGDILKNREDRSHFNDDGPKGEVDNIPSYRHKHSPLHIAGTSSLKHHVSPSGVRVHSSQMTKRSNSGKNEGLMNQFDLSSSPDYSRKPSMKQVWNSSHK